MSDREHHCPFLNRADHRCSDFFSIEQLQHAFEHCFHTYKACAVYQELLDERQARRGQVAARAPGQFVWTTACPPRDSARGPTQTRCPLPEVRAFLLHLAAERGLADNSLHAYRRDLEDMDDHFRRSGKTLLTADADDFRAYLQD